MDKIAELTEALKKMVRGETMGKQLKGGVSPELFKNRYEQFLWQTKDSYDTH